MDNERKLGIDPFEDRVASEYQWQWPPIPVDKNSLGWSKTLVELLSGGLEGQAVADVMNGVFNSVDVASLKNVYRLGRDAQRHLPLDFPMQEKELFEGLRDNLLQWFLDSPWMIQPKVNTHSYTPKNGFMDTRYHRLLLPAHMINLLTKLVENNRIGDVDRHELEAMSRAAYQDSEQYFTADYFNVVKKRIDQTKFPPNGIGISFDMKAWKELAGFPSSDVVARAKQIREDSYQNNMISFTYPKNSSGLYFMKSVLMATMQEWHQQRLSIDGMIPSIARQQNRKGYSAYDFKTNGAMSTDMHTSDKRFPFQRYVAHYLQVANS